MKELRRLLIEGSRLQNSKSNGSVIPLEKNEAHYLTRVLRLRKGDCVNVVDGLGHLWKAFVQNPDSLKLASEFDTPLINKAHPTIKTCLAIVLPKKGFEETLRMSCEMGVDIIQPLTSDYRVSMISDQKRFIRWESILKEAVEQSERFWMPELRKTITFQKWITSGSSGSAFSIARTRSGNSIEFHDWMESLQDDIKEVWVAIGPEGGWSDIETSLAIKESCVDVKLAETILRTSTAALAASQMMVNWRRLSSIN